MDALDKIHEQGYVHSDVREANLLFPTNSPAKLIDFDLSDQIDSIPRGLQQNRRMPWQCS